MIKYREFEIRYNDPSCTVLREVPNQKIKTVYKKEFETLEAGLSYILERLVATESKDIQDAINTMRYVKNDLKEACNKIKLEVSPPEIKPIEPKSIKRVVPETPKLRVTEPIKRIIKK